ncbi:plasmid pRiA4b ORF-3 family protein [Phytohabitans aurantiacus]|uniref:plasmid pRiA4b ORF-3 family protein n=1 Tax=Phytohabitans aurantiacus TaxID=3016789 RepID=UPI002490D660|nr:plasmid pRiA4b ORF-3 family protein [Phytohabitans aurantiacus]
MSPVSRGRKRGKRSTGRSEPLAVIAPPAEDCDCPACSGEDVDPDQMIDDMVGTAASLLDEEDPIAAELLGAIMTATFAVAAEDLGEAAHEIILKIAERGSREALALLLAFAAVAQDSLAESAMAGADQMRTAGVTPPPWADEINAPVTATDYKSLADKSGTASLLSCTFHRSGHAHGLIVMVDEEDCGAAADILLLDPDQIPVVLKAAQAGSRRSPEALDPAEFRWRVETALDARAVHDAENGIDEDEPLYDEDGPGYLPMATLVRKRMSALPAPTKPPAPHGGQGIGRGASRSRVAKLPTKRKKSMGPAPIYQIKVTLSGARPPIWRRLEVPGDISLPVLHDVLQIAFDWDDSHMHVFDTPYGQFGTPDVELGHQAESRVTLEQVAPGAGSEITYTYDFGDNWEHEILVEKLGEPKRGAVYPRCTGGRRAAPPDDCGGVWGYEGLMEALADPTHDDHETAMEWMGFDDPADFDPARFDAAKVTSALTEQR